MPELNSTLFPLGESDPKKRLHFLHIDVTVRCNLHCSYCYYGDFNTASAQKQEVSLERLLSLLVEARGLGCTRVIMSGGEAFMSKKIWPLIDKCAELGLEMSFITNGTLITKDTVRKLEDVKALLYEIKVSYDGLGHDEIRGVGNGAKTLNAIDMFAEAKLPWTVNTILTKKNVGGLRELYFWLKEKIPKSWRIDHPFMQGNVLQNHDSLVLEDMSVVFSVAAEILADYLASRPPFEIWMFNIYRPGLEAWDFTKQRPEMHPCTYNKRNVAIRGNGEVTPCSRLLYELSNAKKTDLKDALTSDRFKEFWSISINDIASCRGCRYLGVCGSGCRAHAYYQFKTIMRHDPMACTIMPLYEQWILPLFTLETQASFASLLNEDGAIPDPTHGASKGVLHRRKSATEQIA